jgi:hypothetical protein
MPNTQHENGVAQPNRLAVPFGSDDRYTAGLTDELIFARKAGRADGTAQIARMDAVISKQFLNHSGRVSSFTF